MYLDSKGRRKFKILFSGIIVLAIFIFIILFPKAEITITYKRAVFTKTYEFKPSTAVDKVLPTVDLIPAVNIANKKDDNYLYLLPSSLIIKKQDLISFLREKIDMDIGPGKRINLEDLQYDLETPAKDMTVKVSVIVSISPLINQKILDDCRKKIRGKSRVFVLKNFYTLCQIEEGAAVSISPDYLFFIPFINKRIEIEIQ